MLIKSRNKKLRLETYGAMKNIRFYVILLGLLTTATSFAGEYKIVDLSGGLRSNAIGINDLGQVVGHSYIASGQEHACMWTPPYSHIRDLGTLGGGYSYATDINNSGQIVGYSGTDSGPHHAFLWTESDGMIDLGTPGKESAAFGINNSGQVVGYETTSDYWSPHAFLWTADDGMIDLGTLGSNYSKAIGINDSGQVVGFSKTKSGQEHAFLWTIEDGMRDLGTLEGDDFSGARKINNSGQIVGYSGAASGPHHAFLWTDSEGMIDLGTPVGFSNSAAESINDLGQIVGNASTVSDMHPFLWDAEGGIEDLGTPGGGSGALSINDSGQIVGFHSAFSSSNACMWIPLSCTPVSLNSLIADQLVVPLGTSINFEATIMDGCGEIDALWDFDDETFVSQVKVTSPVTIAKTYAMAGVYSVVLTVSDEIVDVSDYIMVVVYDPTDGFVTGSGWIDSHPGAYVPDPTLEGKANFGFVSRYKKGATAPTGQTEFVFKAGDLNFHSSSYEWLVVTGSDYARFKGSGTINGFTGGEYGEYRFMLWAGDNPDTFGIRIWEEDELSGEEWDVYHNGMDQPIEGGSIMVHTN